MFSDAELKSIMLAVLRGRPEGASECTLEQALQRALDWGSKVRTQTLLLDLVVSGKVVIAVTPEGELRFSKGRGQDHADHGRSTTNGTLAP
jgi:hypothetical protein